MYQWVQLEHIAKWCKAKNLSGLPAGVKITSISTDTRSLLPGELFVALRGDNFDGHDHIDEAVEKGAVAVIAEKPVKTGVPVLVVKSALSSLVSIGSKMRERFTGQTVAVTGSAGKSSTKEILARLLGPNTVCSPASFNNLLGVSKTLFLVDEQTEHLVLEMGMNAQGEIRELCEHFHPEAGLITNIGDAHIGKLGGERNVYRAKKELFDYLAKESGAKTLGVALNKDDAKVLEAHDSAFQVGIRSVSYSACPDGVADVVVRKRAVNPRSGFLDLSLEIKGEVLGVELPIFGLHHAQNIAAALAMVVLLGIRKEDFCQRLSSIRPASHRGEVLALSDDRILIDECYNSNPTALNSALLSLGELDSTRRRVIVLGDMLELGEYSESLHRKAGEEVTALYSQRGIDFVLVGVGDLVSHLIAGAKGVLPDLSTHHVPGVSQAIPLLLGLGKRGDIVFIKSSRGGRLERLVPPLVGQGAL